MGLRLMGAGSASEAQTFGVVGWLWSTADMDCQVSLAEEALLDDAACRSSVWHGACMVHRPWGFGYNHTRSFNQFSLSELGGCSRVRHGYEGQWPVVHGKDRKSMVDGLV